MGDVYADVNDLHTDNRREAEPERYIRTLSGTLLGLAKIMEGAFAGYSLFILIKAFGSVLKELFHNTGDVISTLEMIFSELRLSGQALNELTGSMVRGFVLPFFVWIAMGILIITGLVLVIIETIALLTLRFRSAGASIVGTVHKIYMWIEIIELGLLIYSVIEYVRNYKSISNLSSTAVGGTVLVTTNIVLVIVGVIVLIVLLLRIFYHKDIAAAMKTVTYEVETGWYSELKRTHLSGISIVFALPYILVLLASISQMFSGNHTIVGDGSQVQTLVVNGVCLIMAIKQLAVCFCNENLKKAHRERS